MVMRWTQWPTSALGSGMYWDNRPRLIGFQLLPPSSVRKAGGFEVVIDGVGNQQSISQSIQLCKPGGRVVVYGVPLQGELALPVLEAFRKDLSLHISRLYPRSFDAGFALLQRRQLDLETVITTRIRLAQAPEAIRDLSERRGEMIKILIDPRGGET
ncbi:MAG: hypothetical protein EXS58_07540 [Candidatus Latescibacteria bacterium]|nr:hypothetical protein [Candidatus Latescibacterota bacterium]